MKTPDPIEIRASRDLQNTQAGSPFNAFNRGSEIRHAMLDSWWERGLAVVTAGLLTFALGSYLVRTFWR